MRVLQSIDPSVNGLNLQALEYLTSPFSYSLLYDIADYMALFDTNAKVNTSPLVLYKNTTETAYFAGPKTVKPINTYSGLSIYVPQVRNRKLNEWYRQLSWYRAVYQ